MPTTTVASSEISGGTAGTSTTGERSSDASGQPGPAHPGNAVAPQSSADLIITQSTRIRLVCVKRSFRLAKGVLAIGHYRPSHVDRVHLSTVEEETG